MLVCADRAGDAEVRHQRVIATQQDVFRLDVAMDDAVLVRVLERVRRLAGDAKRVIQRQLLLPIEPVPETLPLDERHGEPEPAGRLAGIEDGEDVGMLQPRGEPDLALKSLGTERRGKLGVEHLERDRAVVPHVLCEVDRRHAASTELSLDRVAAGQRVAPVPREGSWRSPQSVVWNRGLPLSGAKLGSIRSQPGER